MAHSINLPSAGGSAYLRTGRPSSTTGVASAMLEAAVSGFSRLMKYFASERRIRRSIHELGQLDDHMLRDIGIPSRGQIVSVARFGRRSLPEIG